MIANDNKINVFNLKFMKRVSKWFIFEEIQLLFSPEMTSVFHNWQPWQICFYRNKENLRKWKIWTSNECLWTMKKEQSSKGNFFVTVPAAVSAITGSYTYPCLSALCQETNMPLV